MAQSAKSGLVETIQAAVVEHRSEILRYNDQYKTDDSAENGPRVLFQKGNSLLEANEAERSVISARDEYDRALETVQNAKNAFVQAVAAQLGIEAQVEKPKPPKEEYEAAKVVMEKAQGAVKTLQTLAEYSPNLQEEIDAFVASNPLPSLARPAQERREGPTAPKYRVTVSVPSGDNGEVTEINGFTKAAQAVKDSSVTAAAIREAYEAAGGKGDGTFTGDLTVGSLTLRVADRPKAS